MFIQQFFSHNVKYDKLTEIINYKNNYAQFNIINTYGLFANMTTQRNEIVIEGSLDGKNWKEYTMLLEIISEVQDPPDFFISCFRVRIFGFEFSDICGDRSPFAWYSSMCWAADRRKLSV